MSLIEPKVLAAATPHELLATYESFLGELRRRKVVRTNDAPLGQWAEWLARDVLLGTFEGNSRKGTERENINSGELPPHKCGCTKGIHLNTVRFLWPVPPTNRVASILTVIDFVEPRRE